MRARVDSNRGLFGRRGDLFVGGRTASVGPIVARAQVSGLTDNPTYGPTAQNGVQLTASLDGASAWKWQVRSGPGQTVSDIGGATSSTFTPDIGTNVTDGYEIRAVPDDTAAAATFWLKVRHAPATVDTAASASGSVATGETPTGVAATFTGSGGAATSVWQISDTGVGDGAGTGVTGTTGPAKQSGKYYRYVTTYVNSGGSTVSASAYIGPTRAPVVTMGGLAGGVAPVGGNGSVTLGADIGTITARRWGSTTAAADLGTGTNPDVYDGFSGGTLYGVATIGGVEYLVAAPIEFAETPTLTGSLTDRVYDRGVAITAIATAGAFSGSVSSYELGPNSAPLPIGLTLNSGTGEISGIPLEGSPAFEPFYIEVRARNLAGASPSATFSIVVNEIAITDVGILGNTIYFTTEEAGPSVVYYAVGDEAVAEEFVEAGVGGGLDIAGNFAIAGTTTSGDINATAYVGLPKKVTFFQQLNSTGKRSAPIVVDADIVASAPGAFLQGAYSVATGNGPGKIAVTITELPGTGGGDNPVMQYEVGLSGVWLNVPGYAGTGIYQLTMAANATSYSIRLRMKSDIGNGAANPTGKTATSGAASLYTLIDYAQDTDTETGYVEVSCKIPQAAIDAGARVYAEVSDSETPAARGTGVYGSFDLGVATNGLVGILDIRDHYGEDASVQISVGASGESNVLPGALFTVPESVPEDALDAQFTVATGAAETQSVNVTIVSAPTVHSNGAQYPQYRIDGGTWTSFVSYTGPGTYAIEMAAELTEYDFEIRWTNENGSGAANPTPKSATSSSEESAPPATLTSDAFPAGSLGVHWTFLPQTASGKTAPSVSIVANGSDSVLRIAIPDDGVYDLDQNGIAAPHVRQACPDTDLDIRTRVFIPANRTGWRSRGIFVASADFSQVVFAGKGAFNGNGTNYGSDKLEVYNGGSGQVHNYDSSASTFDHIRLTRVKSTNTWALYTHNDVGTGGSLKSTYVFDFVPAWVGLVAESTTGAYDCEFDYFYVGTAPIADGEGGEP